MMISSNPYAVELTLGSTYPHFLESKSSNKPDNNSRLKAINELKTANFNTHFKEIGL